MRGEHLDDSPVDPSKWGSSPHARGAPTKTCHFNHPHGIIPACAGSTLVERRQVPHERDHPRMRGEHPA